MRVFSFGGGVQSTAALVLAARGELACDADDDARPLSAVALYTRQCLAHRLLSATEERELARRWRESGHTDTAARDTLVTHNLRLVADLVHTYIGAHPALRCLGFLDLCQEGTIGLAHAIDLFDERTGNKLSTYATWWIRQAIGRATLDDDPVVRVPVHIHDRMTRERRQMAAQAPATADADGQREQGAHPVRTVRSGRAGVRQIDRPREDEYVAAARRVRSVASLDVPLSSTAQGTAGESTLADLIADPTEDGADMAEAVCERDAIATLRADMRALLTPREWTVLEMRYDPRRAATLLEVSKKIGTSRERVRQIEAAALRKLREGLAQDADEAGTVAVRPKRRGATKPKAPPVPVPVRKPCGAGAVGRGTFGVRIAALLDAEPTLTVAALAARAGVSRDTAWRHAKAWRASHATAA